MLLEYTSSGVTLDAAHVSLPLAQDNAPQYTMTTSHHVVRHLLENVTWYLGALEMYHRHGYE